jgi:pyruvate,orthophosphate dikinase
MTEKAVALKRLYFYDEADASNKKLLGGKGAGLATMTQLGLPVPPGFVITTEVCREYYRLGQRLPEGLMEDVREAMRELERRTGKRFGDPENPLLVSVRSGAAISMPGMMDTILNIGLNDEVVEGLARLTSNERFAYDAYRRLIQMFGKTVMGVPDRVFDEVFEEAKREAGVKYDSELSAEDLKQVVERFKAKVLETVGRPFPQDPLKQLEMAIEAVFRSWMGKRAVDYRREFNITPDIADGTAVNVVTMVFGNMGDDSATGVLFTRDPATGERKLYGEYLINAQGEDVVAGIRTPKPIAELANEMPEVYWQLEEIARRMEKFYQEVQDMEFTVERGKLYMLQTRNGKMTPQALVKTSVDMVAEGIITKERALMRVDPAMLEKLLHPRVDPKAQAQRVATGIAASPGAAAGKVVFDADTAERRGRQGENVILVREETKPEDIHGFFAAKGVLTSRGGATSHAAVVARGIGKPCVVGCSAIRIDEAQRLFTVGDLVVREGDMITIDGTEGAVYVGEVPTLEPELTPELETLLKWADEFRRLGVRANADTPEMATVARRFGAEGIGLCRTERMFNAVDRLPIVVRMIMADTEEERREALNQLLPLQREDFKEILRVMEGLPVTIRLLDPPLHEFLPGIDRLLEEIYHLERKGASQGEIEEKRRVLERARQLAEVNPMLGHRGVRVGISHPEIYEMQVRAICEATAELLKEGVRAEPQIMIPQVAMAEELRQVRELVERVKAEVERERGVSLPIKFGTMMEVVRACLTAGRVARVAEFFSYGTNDLTQGTFSFSREDAENKFLPLYIEKGVVKHNPFQTLDTEGVGRLVKLATEEGKAANPDLEVGICGEHGGDPASIEFFHWAGLDYVSASPYRIPVARLAAARAAIKFRGGEDQAKAFL